MNLNLCAYMVGFCKPGHIYYIYIYVIVISQCEYDILVNTRVQGGAEDEC